MPYSIAPMLRYAGLAGLLIGAAPLVQAADVLLVGNKDGASVSALSTTDGKQLLRLPVGSGPHEVVVSDDNRLAVVGNYGAPGKPNNSLTVIDWPARQVLRTVELGDNTFPHGIRFLPDNQRIVVTTEGSDSLLIVDLKQGRVLERIAIGAGKPHMVVLSPDATRAYVTHVDGGSLSVVDLKQQKKIAQVTTGKGSEGIAISKDGAQVLVSNREADEVVFVDTQALKVTDTLKTGQFPIRIVMTPDGKYALVTNARSAELAVIDVAAKKELKRIALAQEGVSYRKTMLGEAALPIGATVSSDGKRAYVAVSGGEHVAVIDTATWTVIERWKAGPEPDALALVKE